MKRFKTMQESKQDTSWQLTNAIKNGIIAVTIMSLSSCLSIIFLLFLDDLPNFITQNSKGIKQFYSCYADSIDILLL
ncbi:hypothetical protein [Campylobacter sp.]|uniref:hypothetical protein n=1 Tax=Campylobacter sp. TaxID=205 RepID=UPI0026FB88DD|nr:hypothetical protein [Campylobacter sp.]